jgi:hypothetical protein
MALTPRWTPLRPHPTQIALIESRARFKVVPAGRRSGKTERAKRQLIKSALRARGREDPRYFAAAPTRDQAKAIYWEDLKALVPRNLVVDKSETDLMLRLINGAELWVLGLDKPERVEGRPWDGGILDEFANMKPAAWGQNVRPALDTLGRPGWCWLIGVPEGRNHYYDLWKYATSGSDPEWQGFSWHSSDILPPEAIEAAKRQLDELTFQQEYEASFVNFEGRAYYPFTEAEHCARLTYSARNDLVFCFDFNVDPGVCAVAQEQRLPSGFDGTGIIGEVHIPRNSNTPAVCKKLIQDWGSHEGRVQCYGDATGGSRGTAKVQGSDWDLIAADLGAHFGSRLHLNVGKDNPKERARINAVNARLKATDGSIRLMVDPSKAPETVKDFEGVKLLKGGSGEIDKKDDPRRTHLTDGVGYYVEREFPIISREVVVRKVTGY